jgi:hypothetical protein
MGTACDESLPQCETVDLALPVGSVTAAETTPGAMVDVLEVEEDDHPLHAQAAREKETPSVRAETRTTGRIAATIPQIAMVQAPFLGPQHLVGRGKIDHVPMLRATPFER